MSHKAIVILLIVALSFFTGAAAQYWWPGLTRSPADWFYIICGSFLIFAWYRLDSRQRLYKTSPWLDLTVIAVAVIGLPYYLFRSRGLKYGSLATLMFLGGAMGMSVLAIAGQLGVYYALQA